jgi:lycopene cyclase domain-containing protein
VSHLTYVAVLGGCLVGAGWLEVAVRTRVLRRWRRLLLTLLPVLVVFTAWDAYAVSRGQWSFDPDRTTGVRLPGRLPLEEVLFFVVVPACAVLAFEAVRAVKGWAGGDEATAPSGDLRDAQVTDR